MKWFADWLTEYGVLYQDACRTQSHTDEELAFLKMASKAGFAKPAGLTPKIRKIIGP